MHHNHLLLDKAKESLQKYCRLYCPVLEKRVLLSTYYAFSIQVRELTQALEEHKKLQTTMQQQLQQQQQQQQQIQQQQLQTFKEQQQQLTAQEQQMQTVLSQLSQVVEAVCPSTE